MCGEGIVMAVIMVREGEGKGLSDLKEYAVVSIAPGATLKS